ncbi:MAG: hypothetical protein K2N43_04130, partial [Lachnospiraceae bacterium]|nr:hypothetical protein [Lachnospiraceae bacterium]
ITWEKGELKFDLYRKEVPKDQVPDYVEGNTYIYELTADEVKQTKEEYATYKQNHTSELVKEDYTLTPSEEGEWKLLIENLEQTDETGENVYQYYLVETSMGETLSESDYWMGVQYETSATGQYHAEITVTNTIVSDYLLPETGAEGSWTDKIIGWFQAGYQKIVHFFSKEDE